LPQPFTNIAVLKGSGRDRAILIEDFFLYLRCGRDARCFVRKTDSC